MKKSQILILIIILTGCCKEPNLLKNGLTKKANKITEFSIKIDFDSLNHKIFDTITITEKFYNENNQIINRVDNILFENMIMEIDYIYDKSNRLQKEIVKLPFDTSTVNYFYKDTLLYRTSSNTIVNSEFEFEQTTDHKYNRNNLISETSTSQLFIDIESGDTTRNTLEIDRYNIKGRIKESHLINFSDPEGSKRNLYEYKCGRLISTENYNEKDSLISITYFEYIFDEFENWIEMRTKEDNELKYVRKRQFTYK